jgi:hypothetical protein
MRLAGEEKAFVLFVKACLKGGVPIEPLPLDEWRLLRCPGWQYEWCWWYEFWRESKTCRNEIAKWRDHFCQWVETRLTEQRKDIELDEVSSRRKIDDYYHLSMLMEINRVDLTGDKPRAMSEEFYQFVYQAGPWRMPWLLRDWPEFPATAWLTIPPNTRQQRLKKYGATPKHPDPKEPPSLTAGVDRLRGADGKLRSSVTTEWPTGFFTTIQVIEVDWKLSCKELLRRFQAYLEQNRPKGALKWEVRGRTSYRDRLKALGALRLMRHCKGNWRVAAQIAFNASEKDLYSNQTAWLRATNTTDRLITEAFGR